MRGTILAYDDVGDRPSADIRLADGDTVRIRLHAAGMVIEAVRPAAGILVRADADQVARLCAAIAAPGQRRRPLAILSALVSAFATAEHIRQAFAAMRDVLD